MEGVGTGVRVCTAPEGVSKEDTVGMGSEEGEDTSVTCPDWVAESVGLDGVDMRVEVVVEVKEVVDVGEAVDAIEGVG